MDKQCKNIRLNEDGSITFKTGHKETPKNRVVKLTRTNIYFEVQTCTTTPLVAKMDVADYFAEAVWAYKQKLDHPYPRGIVACELPHMHKSLAAKVMNTVHGKQRVIYKDGDHLNLCRNNLIVVGSAV